VQTEVAVLKDQLWRKALEKRIDLIECQTMIDER
jgi:hypothetical protein